MATGSSCSSVAGLATKTPTHTKVSTARHSKNKTVRMIYIKIMITKTEIWYLNYLCQTASFSITCNASQNSLNNSSIYLG